MRSLPYKVTQVLGIRKLSVHTGYVWGGPYKSQEKSVKGQLSTITFFYIQSLVDLDVKTVPIAMLYFYLSPDTIPKFAKVPSEVTQSRSGVNYY